MPDVRLEITGLAELQSRLRAFPGVFARFMRETLGVSLGILHENVPPYPAPPPSSTYRRTGTLGRTLGAGGGRADIYEVKQVGSGGWSGEFGTRLDYAPHVIGESTQAEHMGHWWTMGTIAKRAKSKIEAAFRAMADRLAKYVDRGTQ